MYKNGVEEHNYFTLDGNYFRLKSFLVNEPWTLADLASSVKFNQQGINGVYPLPSELNFKPEGLAFTTEGDLYLSSEGFKNGFLNGMVYFFKNK